MRRQSPVSGTHAAVDGGLGGARASARIGAVPKVPLQAGAVLGDHFAGRE